MSGISVVPGFAKITSTPKAFSVLMTAWAPVVLMTPLVPCMCCARLAMAWMRTRCPHSWLHWHSLFRCPSLRSRRTDGR